MPDYSSGQAKTTAAIPEGVAVGASTIKLDISTPALNEALEKAISKIDDAKRGQLTLDVTLKGASVEVGHKVANDWLVGGWAGVEFGSGKKQAGIKVKGAW